MIDKIMKKYGYEKTEESEHGVFYNKREPQGYDHVVCVIFKFGGKHLMQSYDKEVIKANGRYINSVAGVEIPVLLMMWMKAKYIGIKFHWRRLVR